MWAKIQTIIIVVILSCLIWVFAEREVTKNTIVSVKIELTAPEDILLRFLDNDDNPLTDSSQMVDLTVEGPGGKIQKVRQEYLNQITRDVASMGIALPDDRSQQSYDIPVVNILDGQLHSRDRQNWLRVVDAKPKFLRLQLTRLARQFVPVVVYYNGAILTQAKVDPAEVETFVLNGKPAEARATLTPAQYQQAQQNEPVSLTAKAVLQGHRPEEFEIKFTISANGQQRPDKSIKAPRLGIVMPYIMEGQYKVILDDTSQLDEYDPIDCRGTPEALDAYQKSDVHLTLKINESDIAGIPAPFSRPLSYYVPLGCNEIEIINKKQTPINFRLEKIPDLTQPQTAVPKTTIP
jgi:hypothetical protein